jgi:hypothetical protein
MFGPLRAGQDRSMGVALAIIIGLVVVVTLNVALPPIGVAALIAFAVVAVIVFSVVSREGGSTGQSGQTR